MGKATPARAAVMPKTDNLTAYELYLQARPLFAARVDLDKAEALLTRAVARIQAQTNAIIAPRIGETGKSPFRSSNSCSGVPARSRASHSSGSYSTPIGFVAIRGPCISAFASSAVGKQSTWNSI